jgi:hypothetical protein
MAHEAGHLMGLDDQRPGAPDNIMFNKGPERDPGVKPSRTQIDSIEKQANRWEGSLANEKDAAGRSRPRLRSRRAGSQVSYSGQVHWRRRWVVSARAPRPVRPP